ncbi:MAG TPA: SCO family protein [Acidimicrobiales bacterium]|nr:SCO family protein [Acidimicrobiales bacterium]
MASDVDTDVDVVASDGRLTDADRAAALSAGAPRVPRRAVAWGLAVAAVLALGGTVLERVVSNAGLNPKGTTSTTLPVRPPSVPTSLGVDTLLGLDRLAPRAAPPIGLSTLSGRPFSLRALRGRVVVISFFDASCTDQCAVLARELAVADARLGPLRARVVLLTVNTDPREVSTRPRPLAVTASGLAAEANWTYLTGPLRDLDAVWHAYDVSIDVYPSTGLVIHTDPMWVLAPDGRLALRLTPLFAQTRSGVYTLPGVLVRRAGAGLAHEVAALLGRRS